TGLPGGGEKPSVELSSALLPAERAVHLSDESGVENASCTVSNCLSVRTAASIRVATEDPQSPKPSSRPPVLPPYERRRWPRRRSDLRASRDLRWQPTARSVHASLRAYRSW